MELRQAQGPPGTVPRYHARSASATTFHREILAATVLTDQMSKLNNGFEIFSGPGQVAGLDGFVGNGDCSLNLDAWSEADGLYLLEGTSEASLAASVPRVSTDALPTQEPGPGPGRTHSGLQGWNRDGGSNKRFVHST